MYLLVFIEITLSYADNNNHTCGFGHITFSFYGFWGISFLYGSHLGE